MDNLWWPLSLAFGILAGIPLVLGGIRHAKLIFTILALLQMVLNLALLPFLTAGRTVYAWAEGQLPPLAFSFQAGSKMFFLLNAFALLAAGHFLPAEMFSRGAIVLILALAAALNGLALSGNIFTALLFAELVMILFYLLYALKWPQESVSLGQNAAFPTPPSPPSLAILAPNFILSSLLLWPGVILLASLGIQDTALTLSATENSGQDMIALLMAQQKINPPMQQILLGLFIGGWWLRLGMFPFHRSYLRIMLSRPVGINLFFILYLGILVLQIWPQFIATFLTSYPGVGHSLEVVLFWVMAYLLLQACARLHLREKGLYFISGQICFLLMMAVVAWHGTGALLLWANTFLVAVGLGLLGEKFRRLNLTFSLAYHPEVAFMRYFKVFFILLALAAAFFPLTPGILGPRDIFYRDISIHLWPTGAGILNFILAAACWLQSVQLIFALPRKESTGNNAAVLTPPPRPMDFMPYELALAIGVVLLILANGIFPQWPYAMQWAG